MVSIPVAPVSSVLSSGFLHTEAGASGASVILSCRRLYVNHTGNQGNSWVRPPSPCRLAAWEGTQSHKSWQIHRWVPRAVVGSRTEPSEQYWIAVLVNSPSLSLSLCSPLSSSRSLFSLSLSLYDFRFCCFILQLPSNRLASVSVSMCSRGGGRCGRESSSSPLSDSISFSVPLLKVLMDAEYVSSHLEHYHQQQPSVFLNLFHFVWLLWINDI